ncbi:MAG: hypothetical protein KKH57_04110, partial [Candidatus Omnitrophica bacterium]|nr:hypothetical protein [Candidatus Omnitrophota bacterium]
IEKNKLVETPSRILGSLRIQTGSYFEEQFLQKGLITSSDFDLDNLCYVFDKSKYKDQIVAEIETVFTQWESQTRDFLKVLYMLGRIANTPSGSKRFLNEVEFALRKKDFEFIKALIYANSNDERQNVLEEKLNDMCEFLEKFLEDLNSYFTEAEKLRGVIFDAINQNKYLSEKGYYILSKEYHIASDSDSYSYFVSSPITTGALTRILSTNIRTGRSFAPVGSGSTKEEEQVFLVISLIEAIIYGDFKKIKSLNLGLPEDFVSELARNSYELDHMIAFAMAELLGRKPMVKPYRAVVDQDFMIAAAHILSAVIFTSERPAYLYDKFFVYLEAKINKMLQTDQVEQAGKGEILLFTPFLDLKRLEEMVAHEYELGIHYYPLPSYWRNAYCRDDFMIRVSRGELVLVTYGSYDEFFRDGTVNEELKGIEAESKLRQIGIIGGRGVMGIVKGSGNGKIGSVAFDLLPRLGYAGHTHPVTFKAEETAPSIMDINGLEADRRFYSNILGDKPEKSASFSLLALDSSKPLTSSIKKQASSAVVYADGIYLSKFRLISEGFEVADITYDNAESFAAGRVIRIAPGIGLDIWVNNDSVAYDFSRFFRSEKFTEAGKEFKEFPGMTLSHFIKKYEPVFAVNGHQGNFYLSNTLIIKNGRLISKFAESAYGLKDDILAGCNGRYNFFVLDSGFRGFKTINLVNGQPQEVIKGIYNALTGPVLARDGLDEISSILQAMPPSGQDEVTWDPVKTSMAFSLFGKENHGNLIQVSMRGYPQERPEMRLEDIRKIIHKFGLSDAILLGTSADVQQYVAGEEVLCAQARRGSDTGAQERPLGSIIYIKFSSPLTPEALIRSQVLVAPSAVEDDLLLKFEKLEEQLRKREEVRATIAKTGASSPIVLLESRLLATIAIKLDCNPAELEIRKSTEPGGDIWLEVTKRITGEKISRFQYSIMGTIFVDFDYEERPDLAVLFHAYIFLRHLEFPDVFRDHTTDRTDRITNALIAAGLLTMMPIGGGDYCRGIINRDVAESLLPTQGASSPVLESLDKVSLVKRNIAFTTQLIKDGQVPDVIGTVGNSASQGFWQTIMNIFAQTIGAQRGIALKEDLPTNQAFGILYMWHNLRDIIQNQNNPLSTLFAFVFGSGSRSTPFTETDCAQKPAIQGPFRVGARYISAVELAMMYFIGVQQHIWRSGFRGIVIKWGDEIEIPILNLSQDNPLFKNADIVRFVSLRRMNDDEARNKDWVGVDSENRVTAFIPRRSLQEMGVLADKGLLQRREDGLYGGINLGSVAISYELLEALLTEFKSDVLDPKAKRGDRPDLDPQFFTALCIAAIADSQAREAAWQESVATVKAMKEFNDKMPGVLSRIRNALDNFEQMHNRPIKMVAMDFLDQYWA